LIEISEISKDYEFLNDISQSDQDFSHKQISRTKLRD